MATEDKYDRQIRIWGEEGQRRLNQSKILCLGLSAAGTETLKNLVLPGFGFITIVTDALVQARDFGRNFFVEQGSEGTPLGEVKPRVSSSQKIPFFISLLLRYLFLSALF